jgi:hypothetical protein
MPASKAEQVLDALKALLETVPDAVVERKSGSPRQGPWRPAPASARRTRFWRSGLIASTEAAGALPTSDDRRSASRHRA